MANEQLQTLIRHLRATAAPQGAGDLADGQLLERFAEQQDAAAFTALVQRHGRLVQNVCRHVLHHEQDAEDAFQATFLVLARHAGTVRKKPAVASWLHGVAYRTALQARRSAARRRFHEQRMMDMPPRQPSCDTACRELQAILDEEIQRLAETYRAPFVLCCLEGRSKGEAARELGLKEGTVSGRLARARQQLRRRLARRGVTLSASLGALALTGRPTEAALVKAAVRVAVLDAGKGLTAGAVPARVAELARGVSRSMLAVKVKTAVALLLFGLAALGAGLLGRQALADPPPAAAPPARPAAERPPAARPENARWAVELSGRVLDPDGRPVRGARVLLYPQPLEHNPVRSVSAADGAFRLGVSPEAAKPAPWGRLHRPVLMASAPGFGAAVTHLDGLVPTQGLTLRLVKDDVPIRGRVRDLEGRPVAGVTVKVIALKIPNTGDLAGWLEAVGANPRNGMQVESRFFTVLTTIDLGPVFPPVRTGADGRFRITGVGRERLVALRLEGPTIETARIQVRTRPGKTYRVTEEANYEHSARITYYGAAFDHPAGPTLPVVGAVRDQDTGKPLAGVNVRSTALPGGSAYGGDWVQTTTDKDGRYRLVGLPKTAGNALRATPVAGQPYLPAVKKVGDLSGFQPATVDLQLKRGVHVRGRVTDAATGKPVSAQIHYFYFVDNPYRKEFPAPADIWR